VFPYKISAACTRSVSSLPKKNELVIQGLRFRVLGPRVWVFGWSFFVFRVSGFRFRVSGFEFRVSGWGFACLQTDTCLGAVRCGWIPGYYVTKFAPHKALGLIARGKLTFDERVVLHREIPVVPAHFCRGALSCRVRGFGSRVSVFAPV
jgi:hypothetical protein